jgi:hypothetical protein
MAEVVLLLLPQAIRCASWRGVQDRLPGFPFIEAALISPFISRLARSTATKERCRKQALF